MDIAEIEEMVRFLRGWGALAALQGERVQAMTTGQDRPLPLTTYTVVDSPRLYHQEGASHTTPRVQFDCYASSYRGAHALAEALRGGVEAFVRGMGWDATIDGGADVGEPPELGRWRVRVDVVFVVC